MRCFDISFLVLAGARYAICYEFVSSVNTPGGGIIKQLGLLSFHGVAQHGINIPLLYPSKK